MMPGPLEELAARLKQDPSLGASREAPAPVKKRTTSFDNPLIQKTFREYKSRGGEFGPKAWYQNYWKEKEYEKQYELVKAKEEHKTDLLRMGIIDQLRQEFGVGMEETGGDWLTSKEDRELDTFIRQRKAILWQQGVSPASAHLIAIAEARKAFPHLSSQAITASINSLTTIPKQSRFGDIDIGVEIGPYRAAKLSNAKIRELLKDKFFQSAIEEAHKYRQEAGEVANRDGYLRRAYDDLLATRDENGRTAYTVAEARKKMAEKAMQLSLATALAGLF